MTAFCYLWLFLPADMTKTPIPAVALFGLGQGFAPRKLVDPSGKYAVLTITIS